MSNISIFIPHEGCPQNCSFCNQKIISGQTKRVTAQQVDSILKRALSDLSDRAERAQIAFFGGSFTAIDREYMTELLEAAAPYANRFDGIRVSTRPDAVDEEVLSLLKSYSVKAVELGAQSMNDEVLRKNNRGHTAEDVRNACRLIRKAGMELGVQMMTGLYGANALSDTYTAEELIKLSPDTVRIYPTVVLRATELDTLFRAGRFTPQTLDEAVELCVNLIEMFESAGVKIIRLGLHASTDIEKNYVAGAYHPAFKELCLSRIYFRRVMNEIGALPGGKYTVYVNPGCLSQAIGQHSDNVIRFGKMGYDIKFKPQNSLEKYEIRINRECF